MADPYKTDVGVVLSKIESTYGTDPTPSGAANAVLAFNVAFDPNPQTPLERKPLRPYLGGARKAIAARHVTLGFDVEMAGAGAAGDAPAYGPLLRMCGLAETLTSETDAQYDPVSSAFESGTHYFNADGVNHKTTGARGNLEVVCNANEVPMFKFAYTGLHVDPAAVSLPTADFTAFLHPSPIDDVNTPTFSLGAYAAKLHQLSINLNNRVAHRPYPNGEAVQMTGRAITGSVSIEAPQIGTKDYFAVAKAETLVALQLIHGGTAGDIVQIDCPAVQLINPRYEDVDGVRHLRMDLEIVPDEGDDEIKITVK